MNRMFPLDEDEPMLATLDADHNVVPTNDQFKWAQFFEAVENRIVAKTRVSGLEVSTVFLGINYGSLAGTEPLWFETMVFADDDRVMPREVEALLRRWGEYQQQRYSTWAEAEEGHAQMVQIIKEGLF
jgi:hypothetical protein